MIRNPNDLQRYTTAERVNHWVVGIGFIVVALSGLALFHPMFWPLTGLFGGGTWTRILHPYAGLLFSVSFFLLYRRFSSLNAMTPADWEWVRRIGDIARGDERNVPEQGKYNGGQKFLFWALAICVVLLTLSGLTLWRAYYTLPVGLMRVAAVVHAAAAAFMIGFIIIHVYAAIWVRGTIPAMWYGTVTRAWARQHHRAWYRQLTGK